MNWIVTAVILLTWVAPLHAQLPAECSSADRSRVEGFTQAAVQALRSGDADRYRAVMRDLDSGLTPGCRAAVASWEPARERCTSSERQLVLDRYMGMIQALTNQDPQRLLGLYNNIEASVSPDCWLAVNQPSHPRIRQACSAAERDLMASFAGPIMRTLAGGNPDEGLQLTQRMIDQVSPDCGSTFMMVAQGTLPPPSGAAQPLPNVYDHGNGTYSVPGTGACTPSGCVAY